MSKEFFDKYGKLVDCFSCNCIEYCSKSDSPLCNYGYTLFAKDKIADLESKLEQIDVLEKALELACDYLLASEGDELYKLVVDIYDDKKYLETKIEYFKTKAKEMMKSE